MDNQASRGLTSGWIHGLTSMANAVHEAYGMVETRGLVAAIEAADAMMKASDVNLMGLEQTMAALITVQVTGETAAVQAAVDAGTAAASKIGEVISSHVIARPASEVFSMQFESPTSPTVQSPASSLKDMTVRQLRTLARSQKSLSLKGREIARANKQQLLKALRKR